MAFRPAISVPADPGLTPLKMDGMDFNRLCRFVYAGPTGRWPASLPDATKPAILTVEQVYIHFASRRLQGIRGEAQPLAIGKAMFRFYNDRAGRQVRHVGSNRVEYLVSGL